jgi:hypothetical protein
VDELGDGVTGQAVCAGDLLEFVIPPAQQAACEGAYPDTAICFGKNGEKAKAKFCGEFPLIKLFVF